MVTSTTASSSSTAAGTTATITAGTSTITPPPSPSEMRRKRRALTASLVDLSSTICDGGSEACPLKTKTGWSTKCIDTTSELYACGGCPGLPGTMDCSDLVGVADVQCVRSTCQSESNVDFLCDWRLADALEGWLIDIFAYLSSQTS
jgi:hypothetical protein